MTDIRWLWVFLDTPEDTAEDTAAADRSAAFWSGTTGWTVSARRGEHDEFATLLPPEGDAWVKLQRVETGGGVHLDLDVAGALEAAAGEARTLGAEPVAAYGTHVVMRSPGGFTFCLTSWERAGAPARQVREGAAEIIDQVSLDIPRDRYAAEVAFWSALTGWEARQGALPEFHYLQRPPGIPVRLLLQRLGEESGPVRGHVDLACADRADSVRWHVERGSRTLAEHELWTVMRDPAGRVYCLTDRSPLTGGLGH